MTILKTEHDFTGQNIFINIQPKRGWPKVSASLSSYPIVFVRLEVHVVFLPILYRRDDTESDDLLAHLAEMLV